MTRRQRRVDVAVYAPLAGPLYEQELKPIGGAELQSAYIVRSLAERGLRVCHVVAGKPATAASDGIELVALPAEYARRGVARRRAVFCALRAADARLYIQRSAGFETLFVGLFARSTRRRFVFSSSSVADFSREPEIAVQAGASLDEWPTRVQYLLGLRFADAVVVQTEDQRLLARNERGVEARVISSFCAEAPPHEGSRRGFLWIGGLVGSKDPLAYVELARRVPEATFWMIATERGELFADLAREVSSRAASAPNLELLPPTRRDEILALYPQAVAVVNTSWFEGFPNTLLEGWARGVPALSLRIDPDSVIERHRLGAVCHGSLDELATAARQLWEEREAIDPAPLRDYIARVHDPAVVGPQWVALVEDLLGG